jgi:hypothetical protein
MFVNSQSQISQNSDYSILLGCKTVWVVPDVSKVTGLSSSKSILKRVRNRSYRGTASTVRELTAAQWELQLSRDGRASCHVQTYIHTHTHTHILLQFSCELAQVPILYSAQNPAIWFQILMKYVWDLKRDVWNERTLLCHSAVQITGPLILF